MIRPYGDWVVIKMDPIPEKLGSIILTGAEARRVRTGTIVAVGPGRYTGEHRTPVGLEVGERVAFFREHLEHQSGKAILDLLGEYGEDLGMIRAPDVLFAFVGDEEIT